MGMYVKNPALYCAGAGDADLQTAYRNSAEQRYSSTEQDEEQF